MNSEASASGQTPCVRLRLFVAGNTTRSRAAIENSRLFCIEHLCGQADLEVVDIYQQPELAVQHQVVAVPTLLKLSPLPFRRIVGDLSVTDRLVRGLGLHPAFTKVIP